MGRKPYAARAQSRESQTPDQAPCVSPQVANITPVSNIGALSLETMPLKNSLKAEAVSWKTQFAQNLHKQCSDDLKAFDNYIR